MNCRGDLLQRTNIYQGIDAKDESFMKLSIVNNSIGDLHMMLGK